MSSIKGLTQHYTVPFKVINVHVHVWLNAEHVQWNLSITDTIGTTETVLYMEVSLIHRLNNTLMYCHGMRTSVLNREVPHVVLFSGCRHHVKLSLALIHDLVLMKLFVHLHTLSHCLVHVAIVCTKCQPLRCHNVYKDTWTPDNGEILPVKKKTTKVKNLHVV